MRVIFVVPLLLMLNFAKADEASDLQTYENCYVKIAALQRMISVGRQMGSREIAIQNNIIRLADQCSQGEKIFIKKYGYQPMCKTNENGKPYCTKANKKDIEKKQLGEESERSREVTREITEKEAEEDAHRSVVKREEQERAKKKQMEALWE